MSSSLPVVRAEIHYTGHVQGVGFRYAVLHAARGYEVSGVVENLPDGRVRLVAEGERIEVDGFVAEVADRLQGYYRKLERHDSTGPRQCEGFVIR